MIKTNFHTHTNLCDGIDTPEQMVVAAIDKGFIGLGFSGHSFFELDKDITLSPEKLEIYIAEINRLKEEYKDKIELFLGLEQDYYSVPPTYNFDYIIGSVHVIKKNGKFVPVDVSADSNKRTVSEIYNGDFDAFAEDYFETVADVVNKTKADIVGHIDLVSKYSEINGYSQSERFLKAAEKTVSTLTKSDCLFEINTGAMARGTKSIPYPSFEILQMIKRNNGKIIFSSDCHDRRYLDFGFKEAVKLALKAGFTEHVILTKNGKKTVKL